MARRDYPGNANDARVTLDIISPSQADYNCFYNYAATRPAKAALYTNQGGGYAAKWSFPANTARGPGVHDIPINTQNPNFIDWGRSIVEFDRRYLGVTATVWATSTIYTKGQIVSRSVTGWFGGRVVNYRCIADHTSSTTNAPGRYQDGQWRTYWEFNAFADIRSQMRNSTTYTDASLGITNVRVIRAAYEWVRAGYRHTGRRMWH